MSKRKLIWNFGLAHSARPVVAAGLAAHAESLEAHDVRVVASQAEARLATHDLLRTHRSAGLDRSEVEGQWARVCDRVWKHKGVSVLSTPDLCVADKDQIKLALDPLIGVEVHLVLTVDSRSEQLYGGWLAELRAGSSTGWEKYVDRVLAEPRQHRQAEEFWAGHDLEQLLARWGWTFRSERLHVLADESLAAQWSAFLELAGLEGTPDVVVPACPDPQLPCCARSIDTSRTGGRFGAPAFPVGERDSAAPGAGSGVGAGVRDQLDLAVDALADVLAENDRLRAESTRLRADRDRLKRKRRKLKRQVAEAVSGTRDRHDAG